MCSLKYLLPQRGNSLLNYPLIDSVSLQWTVHISVLARQFSVLQFAIGVVLPTS